MCVCVRRFCAPVGWACARATRTSPHAAVVVPEQHLGLCAGAQARLGHFNGFFNDSLWREGPWNETSLLG